MERYITVHKRNVDGSTCKGINRGINQRILDGLTCEGINKGINQRILVGSTCGGIHQRILDGSTCGGIHKEIHQQILDGLTCFCKRVKRKALLGQHKEQRSHIAALQETHLTKQDVEKKYIRKRIGRTFVHGRG